MKIGERFWVSRYYSGQEDYLVEFEVLRSYQDDWLGILYICKCLDINPKQEHTFTRYGSPDVLSAEILKTPEEVKACEEKRKDYEERRQKAMEIFPEGFE